jgi:hypothetical protein
MKSCNFHLIFNFVSFLQELRSKYYQAKKVMQMEANNILNAQKVSVCRILISSTSLRVVCGA